MNDILSEYLSKTQKSSLTHFLKALVKKNELKNEEEILQKFIEDEIYYNEVGNPHFKWVLSFFENDDFISEIKNIIKKYVFEFKMKERQKPYFEMMKQKQKEQRKIQKEQILSKQPPTEKQLKYYKQLCKRYNIEQKPLDDLSKLDLKNMIGEILDSENQKKFKDTI